VFLTKRHLLIQLILAQWLVSLCFALTPSSLPAGWWQQMSAQSILAKAESITHDLSYFEGTKAHLLDDRDASIEFFQRKMPDGTIETKLVYHSRRFIMTVYKVGSGRYFWQNGLLIKTEFEDDQEELSLATKFDHPYDYKILKPEIVGTNDCLVVARIATPEFLQMLKTAYYPGYTTGHGGMLGDPVQFIRSERDTYIRKSDGVIIGEVKKNTSGKILHDRLYDVVQVNNPIPNAEFVLPVASVETATNVSQLVHITAKGIHAYGSLNPGTIKRVRYVIIGTMIISFGALLVLLYFRFHRKNLNSTGDSQQK
jgi:hypothetical protein